MKGLVVAYLNLGQLDRRSRQPPMRPSGKKLEANGPSPASFITSHFFRKERRGNGLGKRLGPHG